MRITLCGSARFERHYKIWNELLSVAGHVVYTLSVYPSDKRGLKNWYNAQDKITLDKIHKEKIDNSDAVLILNVCGYLGESTLSEIDHAKKREKVIYMLESWGLGCGIGHMHEDSVVEAKLGYGIPLGYGSPVDTSGYMHTWHHSLFGIGGSELRSRLVDQYWKFERQERLLAVNTWTRANPAIGVTP